MRRAILCALALLSLPLAPLRADGGRRIFTGIAGPFVLTAFSPTLPLRAGIVQRVSVMVERVSDRTPVLDVHVMIHAVRSDSGNIVEVVAPATHAKATNKMQYAGDLNLALPGKWRMSVEVDGKDASGTVSSEIEVAAPKSALDSYWPFVVLVPLVMLLFAVNRRLRRRTRLRSQPAQP